MNDLRFFILLMLCLLRFDATAQIDYKGFPEWSWHIQDSTEYYLYTPSKSGDNNRYPIVLFLHGCCGEDAHATLRNAVDPPVRMWHNFGANTQTVPTYIVAPKTKVGWSQHLKSLKKVMDGLLRYGNGDPQRIYITGFSMGAAGLWEFLQQYPNYFAAAIPMGMNFKGDHQVIKDIPIWTHRGETDPFADTLHKDVWRIRQLNGDKIDSNANWVTGVNPRFSSYKGYGHVVQWVAASTNDLTAWAYSKLNDGNKYPVVFFRSPQHQQKFKNGETVLLQIEASDPDGLISKVELRLNGLPYQTLYKRPFNTKLEAPVGDVRIEAIAFDNKGKTSVATIIIQTNTPVKLLTQELPFARQGAFYQKQIIATGNGTMLFSLPPSSKLPTGLLLDKNGVISGVPEKNGTYPINIIAADEDGDKTTMQYSLLITEKKKEEIVARNVMNDSGISFPVSKIRKGANTHFDRGDDEVTISNTAGFEGMTFMPGNNRDTSKINASYLSFDIDEDAVVYVAYERKDHLFSSTIPEWLKSWEKLPAPQIVAQYFYYDVYRKAFSKGRIVLPGADEKRNGVSNTYFVLIRKSLSPFQFAPEINFKQLASGTLGQPYLDKLTVLHGVGTCKWQIIEGVLPQGIHLSADGIVSGIPQTSGTFSVTIKVQDENGKTDSKKVSLVVKTMD